MKSHQQTNRALSAREMALKVLIDIEQNEAYANLSLNKHLEATKLSGQEKGFCTELVYGTVRNLSALDYLLAKFVTKPLGKLTVSIRNILRLSLYQLVYLTKIPPSAATNEAVKLAKRYGHEGVAKFVNGVLRNVIRQRDTLDFGELAAEPLVYLSTKYSHPQWLVERWLAELGPEATEALCAANNKSAEVSIRVNNLKMSQEQIIHSLGAAGIQVTPGAYYDLAYKIDNFSQLSQLPQFKSGLLQVQDESSMLVAPVLAPQPGELVLDLCSAPGGKTTHIAQLMQNQGKVVAVDVHPHKLKLVEDNCRRLGITSVETRCLDATDLPEAWEAKFDRVLVDAPCSGLGVLKRRPDSRWRKQPDDISTLANLQAQILREAARCVKPGGSLVYSTCTLTKEENIEQMRKFADQHPEFKPRLINTYLPKAPVEPNSSMLQLWPHIHNTDGFFICTWERIN